MTAAMGVGTDRLSCSGVSVRFGGLMALQDVDIAVPPASIVGLVGPNGAGKSTLFAVLSGLLRPTRGRVLFDGEDVTDASPQERAIRGLARTFQHPELFVGLTVRDHMVLAHRVRHQRSRVWSDLFTFGSLRRSAPSEQDDVDALVDLLGLGPIAYRPALGMPLGVARLIELGRALASGPTTLLLDEPSSGLDSAESERLEAVLSRVAAERGIAVLLVEHDVEMVMRTCSTVNVLDFGSLIASGTPAEVRADQSVKAAYLGRENPSVPTELSTDRSGESASDTPKQGPSLHSGTGRQGTPTSVSVEDLSVRYGDAVALSGVQFRLEGGKALAVLGPNGAGKSSLARALSGLVRTSGGTMRLDHERIDGWPAHRIARAGLVHLPEGRGVFRTLSVIDNLKMAANTIRAREGRREAVERALEMLPILGQRSRQAAGLLSGGEQQMLSLARALATHPRVIVADEMSLGLAPQMVDLVFAGLEEARRRGVTVIMIEQYVHRALGFADECLVLQRGRVAWSGSASEVGSDLLGHYLGEAMTVPDMNATPNPQTTLGGISR